jgi:hypothetical protein
MQVGRVLYENLDDASRKTMHGQAEWLNTNNYGTFRGRRWTAKSVIRLYERLRKLHPALDIGKP